MTKVFVYGTLKKGYHNHFLLQNSRFVGTYETSNKFQLYDGAFPYVVEGGTSSIQGEVYEVGETVLNRLDQLEGVPHHYVRKYIPVFFYSEMDGHGLDDVIIYVASDKTAEHVKQHRTLITGDSEISSVKWRN